MLVVIEEIATYDEVITSLFLTHNDQELWSSLPGAGKRLAPRPLAEWGDDRTRYADGSSVLALAGTNGSRAVPKWQLRQSAKTFCLLQAAAQRPAPVRLAIDLE